MLIYLDTNFKKKEALFGFGLESNNNMNHYCFLVKPEEAGHELVARMVLLLSVGFASYVPLQNFLYMIEILSPIRANNPLIIFI